MFLDTYNIQSHNIVKHFLIASVKQWIEMTRQFIRTFQDKYVLHIKNTKKYKYTKLPKRKLKCRSLVTLKKDY